MSRHLRRLVSIATVAVLALGLAQGAAAGVDVQITISGTVTELSSGMPLAGVCVELEVNSPVATSCTDGAGHYQFTAPVGPNYSLRATAAGYVDMWAGRHYLWWDPVAYQTSTSGVDFRMVHALSSASGVILQPDGTPMRNAYVLMSAVDGGFAAGKYTAADGSFAITGLPPVPMTVSVGGYNGTRSYPTQYVPGRMSSAGAAIFQPGDGSALTINESLLPYGTVVATFIDEATGKGLSGVCIHTIGQFERCSDANGKAVLAMGFGPHKIEFVLPTPYGTWPSVQVDVLPGVVTTWAPIVLTRKTSLTVTTQERDNPLGHPPTCVIAVPVEPGLFASATQTEYRPYCGSYNDTPIEVWLDSDAPTHLFAFSGTTTDANGPPQYGAQWVGATGGTGNRAAAMVIKPVPGVRNSGPLIILDRVSIVYGSVDGPVGGQYCVTVVALPLTIPGDPKDMQVATCTQPVVEGSPRFTMNALGPYQWPLLFTSKNGGAYAWSGGGSSRTSAATVGPFDWTIGQQMPGLGGTLSGTITGGSGGQLLAYDAVTGDYLASSPVTGTSFAITGLNARPVQLQYRPATGSACWPSYPTAPWLPRTLQQNSWRPVLGATTTISVDVGKDCAASFRLAKQPPLLR
jgi:hypothetical protein